MSVLLKSAGVIGLADAAFLAFAPQRWAKFWGRAIRRLGRDPRAARALAATSFGLDLLLFKARVPRRRHLTSVRTGLR